MFEGGFDHALLKDACWQWVLQLHGTWLPATRRSCRLLLPLNVAEGLAMYSIAACVSRGIGAANLYCQMQSPAQGVKLGMNL